MSRRDVDAVLGDHKAGHQVGVRVGHLEALRHLADIHMADTPVSTEDGRELVRCRRNKQWPSFLVEIRKGCGIQQNIGLL